MSFVHLHTHSEYSLLDGQGRIKKLVAEAKRLGQPALALTDHGVMHGAIEFFRTCKEAEIKPVIGVEAYQTVWGRPMGGRDPDFDRENYHLLLLAKNMTGYRNLLKIASHSQLNGYYYRPRIDHDFLAKHAAGIVATTGCMGAEVPQLLSQGKEKEAYDRLGWYVETFGKENFFIEIQEHSIDELRPINQQLVPWADKFGIQLLATNDVHYVREEDGGPHDVLLCVQTGATVHEEKRMRLSDQSYFLKSRAQMEATFRPFIDLPASAFDNSLLIAEMCEVDLEDQNYHLPDIHIPDGFTYETYLRNLTEEGLAQLYGENANHPEVQERKERELKIIHQMGFDVYFLIVADLCRYAKSRNIWWNVRGSGAGSLVAYCTGITGIDPLKNNLIFERFLNPARVSMPDFDLDFPDDQREEMIRYTVQKYGDDQVAQIATMNRMKARAAIRDVGRAKGVPLAQVDRIAKLIPAIPGKPATIQDVLTEGHEFYNPELVDLVKKDKVIQDLVETSMKLEGVARNSGVHAAAVVVADRELTHYTPLMRASKGSITSAVTQYEFPILESIGLLKVDFLGLSTLTVMREAARLIKERHGIEYTLANIPFESEEATEAFKLLSSGEVSGVFQVEGQGMRRVLTEMRPTAFEHIIATISLYRPGPMEYIPQFIRRMHGEEAVEFKHSKLEPILAETYGICVSGDAIVADARTGRRYRLDEVQQVDDLVIQGVDEHWQAATGRVTHWIDSGTKQVFRVTLRNGAHIKVTADHRLLTESGWQPLNALQPGDYIATPLQLFGPDGGNGLAVDRRRLRVLAYLIADGSLASMASVDFVSKDQALIDAYVDALTVFPDVRPVFTEQVRGVTRVGNAKPVGSKLHYHTPTSLLDWMRQLGLKHPAGQRPGGLRSHEKFIPAFVFELSPEDIAYFLAALWDCDGYIGNKLCHYKTISQRLAEDVQALLLRLGVPSTIHTADYENQTRGGLRRSYQVTVYDTARLAVSLQPFMVTRKREVVCVGQSHRTIQRDSFLDEVAATTPLSARALMQTYGIDRQHFYPHARRRTRISAHVVAPLAQALPLPATQQKLGVEWQEIIAIEPVGEEPVYDLTVEGLYSFVANNIIVHNCVYQEQIIQILSQLAGYAPGEADLVRRAVSKKKASDIEKHKKSFVAGCKQNGIPESAAAAIYGDIEFFARYGFNKSHAADYAVICVQTAYLKAKYPVEYMAALLLVERDKTEKVTNFIHECRRMGIEVLPPDVNYSGLDFEIQERPADAPVLAHRDPLLGYNFPVPPGSAIRFGMAATKNVGEAPVEVILKARAEGGPFTSLEDFCDRVDLRQVGKRPLECLIKVGAFDRFGRRSQLLAVLDQMVEKSTQVHNDRASGQLSMFDLLGAGAAQVTAIPLPDIEEVKGKEKLQWEKELLGVYANSHPLQQMSVDWQRVASCSCGELDERYDGKGVALAGMITNVRTINTKKGDQMAFVQIEDMQGQCEVVVFPRTYAEVKDKLIADQIYLFKGKAQTREGQTSLLLDTLQTYVDLPKEVAEETQPQRPLLPLMPTFNGMALAEAAEFYAEHSENGDDADENTTPVLAEFVADQDDEMDDQQDEEVEAAPVPAAVATAVVTPAAPVAATPVKPVNGHASTIDDINAAFDLAAAEAGEALPEPAYTAAQSARLAPRLERPARPVAAPAAERPADNPPRPPSERHTPPQSKESLPPADEPPTGQHAAPPKDSSPPTEEPPPTVEHRGPGNGHRNGKGSPHHGRELRITFRRSGDLERDKFRLKGIYDLVCDPRGRDRFFIRLEFNGQAHELAFPNDHCTITDRLLQELQKHFRVDVVVKEQG